MASIGSPIADWYIVEGINPEPWEASEASVGRRGGGTFVQFHKPPGLRQYQEAIADAFPRQNLHTRMYDGEIFMHFFFWRELFAFEMLEGKKNRRAHAADTSNLNKGLEDALQGILYRNDRVVRHISGTFVEQSAETKPCILVAVWPQDTTIYRYADLVRSQLARPEVEHIPLSRGISVDEIF